MKSRLCDISPGDTAVISDMHAQGSIRRRLRDIGLVEGAQV
ncbi:MAG: ferrous iron transport protein A, partial [Clostridia bacterium]|nr:ferrous iron transport protein A [Clostridia bacterium]